MFLKSILYFLLNIFKTKSKTKSKTKYRARKPYIRKMTEEEKTHLRQLKAKLILLGVRQRQVARETNISYSHVSSVLTGRRNNEKVIKYIEEMR